MKEFFTQKKPSTTAGKCLHACLMESIGLVTDNKLYHFCGYFHWQIAVFQIENGKFSVENSIRFMANMAQGNKEIIKVIEEVSRDCADVEDSDR